MMDIKKEFAKTITVSQYECDLNSKMTAAAVLRQVQQISTDHCTELGFTDEVYRKHSAAFFLAKLSVEFYEDIFVGDIITFLTYPSKAVRAFYPRYTKIVNQDGKILASVDARWILVDPFSRKIYRKPPEGFVLDFGSDEVPTHDISIPKIQNPAFVANVPVSYSRTDINRHLNNTQYADIICDSLPLDLICNSSVAKMIIYYHKEAKLGENLSVFSEQIQNNFVVQGKIGEVVSFDAFVSFKN